MDTDTQTIVIPKDIHRELRIEAAKRDMGIGEAATEAIRFWLKNKTTRKIEHAA